MTTDSAAPERPLPSASSSADPATEGFLRMPTPVGRIELRSVDDAVSAVRFERHGRLPLDGVDERPTAVLLEAAEQIDEYFRGRRTVFDLPLITTGTPFQQAVWSALGEVPFGASTGYGALAAAAGAPQGGRAAGQAVRANAVALLIPCHRVLGTGRIVTGYSVGDGPATKRWLLEHEGIPYRR